MKEIYVIYASNNLEYESYEENVIGYVETEQEAENACKKFEEEALEDRKLYRSLENKCKTCDKRCGCTAPTRNHCELQKQLQELEEKIFMPDVRMSATDHTFTEKLKSFKGGIPCLVLQKKIIISILLRPSVREVLAFEDDTGRLSLKMTKSSLPAITALREVGQTALILARAFESRWEFQEVNAMSSADLFTAKLMPSSQPREKV